MTKDRYVLIEDYFEPTAIQDNENKILYEQNNFDMNKLCEILNKQLLQIEQLKADVKKRTKIIEKGNQKLIEYYNEKINELDKEYNDDLEERFKEIELLKKEQERLKKEVLESNQTIYDEENNIILCGDCYCISNFVREKIDKIKHLQQQLKDIRDENILLKDANKNLYEKVKKVRKEVCDSIIKNIAVEMIKSKLYVKFDDLKNIL